MWSISKAGEAVTVHFLCERIIPQIIQPVTIEISRRFLACCGVSQDWGSEQRSTLQAGGGLTADHVKARLKVVQPEN